MNTFYKKNYVASEDALLEWELGPGGIKFPIINEKQDFVNCIKSRKETMILAEIGHRTTSLCQIGQIAIQKGAKLKSNPETERFTNNDAANKLLTREQHAPWIVEAQPTRKQQASDTGSRRILPKDEDRLRRAGLRLSYMANC